LKANSLPLLQFHRPATAIALKSPGQLSATRTHRIDFSMRFRSKPEVDGAVEVSATTSLIAGRGKH
jgi:hypothetical protein